MSLLSDAIGPLEVAVARDGFSVSVVDAGTVRVTWDADGVHAAMLGLRTFDEEPATLVFLALGVQSAYQGTGFFTHLCAVLPGFARSAGFDTFLVAGTSSSEAAATFTAAGFAGDPLTVDVSADPCPLEVYAAQ